MSVWIQQDLETLKHIHTFLINNILEGFPGASDVKEPACDRGDPGSIPGSGRSPGERNGYPLQCLAWRIPWTEGHGGLQ